jgi:peptidoglycan hydrolase CwlO-like protein
MEASYKNGDLIYFELLLDSRSIEDFISRTTLVQRVMASNSQLASDLKESRITLEKIKAEIERDLETVDAKRAEAEAEEKRLKDLRARHQSKLDAQRSRPSRPASPGSSTARGRDTSRA